MELNPWIATENNWSVKTTNTPIRAYPAMAAMTVRSIL
jgi:hypothetical protein